MTKKWIIKTPFQRKLWELINKTADKKWIDFANRAKIPHGSFREWIKDRGDKLPIEPKRKNLLKICEAGGVDESYFDNYKSEKDESLPKVAEAIPEHELYAEWKLSHELLKPEDRILLEKALEVINSNTIYSSALISNIDAFYQAMKEAMERKPVENPKNENTEKKVM